MNNKLQDIQFNDLPISQEIKDALSNLGIIYPTEIQKKAIPVLISSKIDFHGQAQTGTGKTFAFGIPLIENINRKLNEPQALIIAPTRELALQIYDNLLKISKALSIKITPIYGGSSIEDQINNLKKGAQIVVGTPGRINDMIRREALKLNNIQTLVLDEADIMLDMGFKEEIDEILKLLPKNRQIWLFSATIKSGISDIIKKHMKDTLSIRVNPQNITSGKTKQYYCIVPNKYKIHALTRFIQNAHDFYGFIFCQTKILASELTEELLKKGYNANALHGDMSQNQRNAVIKKFRQKDISILVATDVAARGIDIANLNYVINYSIPEDLESYVHRIGRTGRAGKEGIAITFITKNELRLINQIEKRFNVDIEPINIPSNETLINNRINDIKEFIDKVISEKNIDIKNGIENKNLDEIISYLDNLDKDNINKIFKKLFFDKFFKNLDLTEIQSFNPNEKEEQLQEISIYLGQDDGITKEMIKDLLISTNLIDKNKIKSIRVIKKRSFIKILGDCNPQLINVLRNKTLNNKKIHLNITCLVLEENKDYKTKNLDKHKPENRKQYNIKNSYKQYNKNKKNNN